MARRGPTGERGPTGDSGPTGPQGPQGPKRAEPLVNWIRKPWVPWVIAMLCLLASAFSIEQSIDASNKASTATQRLEQEVDERRDVACKGAEAKHAEEIRDLNSTYRILEDPPRVYTELLQNPIILQNFREGILAAVNDEDQFGEFVSPFCDEKKIGLPEPDPIVPAVPHHVEVLIPGITKDVVRAEQGGVDDLPNADKTDVEPGS